MGIKLNDWLASLPEDEQAEIELRANQEIEKMAVSFVREAVGKTQREIARSLGRSQAYVSKLEGQADMLLSTLRRYVEAAGGKLSIRVEVPGGALVYGSAAELFETPLPSLPFVPKRPARTSAQEASFGAGFESDDMATSIIDPEVMSSTTPVPLRGARNAASYVEGQEPYELAIAA